VTPPPASLPGDLDQSEEERLSEEERTELAECELVILVVVSTAACGGRLGGYLRRPLHEL